MAAKSSVPLFLSSLVLALVTGFLVSFSLAWSATPAQATVPLEPAIPAATNLMPVSGVTPTPTPRPARIRLEGPIEQIGSVTWIVGGRAIVVTPSTVVVGTARLGVLAQVMADVWPNGVLLAIRISIPEQTDQVQFSGVIQQITAAAWVVNGVTVTITSRTIITGAVPQVGCLALVQGIRQSPQIVQATWISVTATGPEPITFRGMIEALTPQRWQISGTDVRITPQTVVFGATPTIGYVAYVTGTRQLPGSTITIIARQIQVKTPQDDRLDFSGVIQWVEDAAWVVNGITVAITSTTVITGLPPAIGNTAYVTGFPISTTIVQAESIGVGLPPRDLVQFRGMIRALNSDQWIVNQVTVTLTSYTVITEGVPTIGDIADVKGLRQPDNSVVALVIRVQDQNRESVEFQGMIQSVGTLSWLVAGRTIWLLPDTEISPPSIRPAAGMFATVRALRIVTGQLLAERIILRVPVNTVEFSGFVQAMSNMHWVVATIPISITSNTFIDEREGPARVGSYVDVRAIHQGNALVAQLIRVRAMPPQTPTSQPTPWPTPVSSPVVRPTFTATRTPVGQETPGIVPMRTVTPTATLTR